MERRAMALASCCSWWRWRPSRAACGDDDDGRDDRGAGHLGRRGDDAPRRRPAQPRPRRPSHGGRGDDRGRGVDGGAGERGGRGLGGRPGLEVRRRLGRATSRSKLWWLGDLEAPGIEAWMDEMVAAFQTRVPERHRRADAATRPTPGSRRRPTACQSESGPDLWYNWSGTWSLEPGVERAARCRTRTSSTPADIAANPYTPGDAVRGEDLALPAVPLRLPDGLQQGAVAAAGLDPEAPPTTWEEFIAALEAIKASGVTPIALGPQGRLRR